MIIRFWEKNEGKTRHRDSTITSRAGRLRCGSYRTDHFSTSCIQQVSKFGQKTPCCQVKAKPPSKFEFELIMSTIGAFTFCTQIARLSKSVRLFLILEITPKNCIEGQVDLHPRPLISTSSFFNFDQLLDCAGCSNLAQPLNKLLWINKTNFSFEEVWGNLLPVTTSGI